MNIYMLKNFTVKEVYFGLTETDCKQAALAHKDNPDSPIGHWKWGEEEIKWGAVQENLYEGHAYAFLQALRREPQEEGWIVVVGGSDE